MADVIDRVEPRHVLLLQEEGGMALALGEDGDQHVRARHLLAAARLHMGHGAMDHALEARGRLGVAMSVKHQAGQLVVDIAGQLVAQEIEVDVAGAHDRRRVTVVDQRQEQMLQRRVFVAALVGILQSAPESLLETGRKRSHLDPHSFSIVHCNGCSCCRAKLVT